MESKTWDAPMKSCDHLRELCCGCPASDDRAKGTSNGSERCKLYEDLGREANRREGGENARADAKHPEDVAVTRSSLSR